MGAWASRSGSSGARLPCRGRDADGERRYSMPDAVREFALEQLGELASRYEEIAAGYFLKVAEEDSKLLLTEEQVPALRRLQREIRHLRTGMDWAMRVGRDEWTARYAIVIWSTLLYHGVVKECEERLRAGIAAARRCGDLRRECSLWCRLAGPLGESERYLELRQACGTG